MATKKKTKKEQSPEMRRLHDEISVISLYNRDENGDLVAINVVDDLRALRDAVMLLMAKVKP